MALVSCQLGRAQTLAQQHFYRSRVFSTTICKAFGVNTYPTCTLERAVGEVAGSDDGLWKQGVFDGAVYPDLPIIGPAMNAGIESQIQKQIEDEQRDGWVVRTVAAQCLSEKDIHARMERVGKLVGRAEGKGAILCVSGGDPCRKMPFWKDGAKDSVYMLQHARKMKAQGRISANVSLWAVANPMLDSVDSYARKVDAGAEVFLTQPPFLPTSEEWFASVNQLSGDSNQAKILVGVPIITSQRNLDFWIRLCGLNAKESHIAGLKKSFPGKGSGPDVFERAVIDWNTDFLQRVAMRMPGISGIHAMPVTGMGRRLVVDILREAQVT